MEFPGLTFSSLRVAPVPLKQVLFRITMEALSEGVTITVASSPNTSTPTIEGMGRREDEWKKEKELTDSKTKYNKSCIEVKMSTFDNNLRSILDVERASSVDEEIASD